MLLPTNEHDPVSPDEYVLRRVPTNWFKSALSEPVQRVAFEPNEQRDVEGISVFREFFVTSIEVARHGPKGLNGYYVVRLLAADIFALGLSIIPDPQEDQPQGHAVIPELNSASVSGGNKQRAKELQYELAKLGSRNIAYSPISV